MKGCIERLQENIEKINALVDHDIYFEKFTNNELHKTLFY